MEDDIKRILQDKQFHLQPKSEQKEIIKNVLEWYIAVIVVFSKSRDKCLKVKLRCRNDRVYVKFVLYSSVTPLSEGKMVMNE
jgi:hypothetical protein